MCARVSVRARAYVVGCDLQLECPCVCVCVRACVCVCVRACVRVWVCVWLAEISFPPRAVDGCGETLLGNKMHHISLHFHRCTDDFCIAL